MRVAALSAPDGIVEALGLPSGVILRRQARGRLDVVLFFVARRHELARRLPGFLRSVSPDGAVWLACPAKRSAVATDLDPARVRHEAGRAGLVEAGACAIGDGWSGVRFVPGDDT